MLQPWKGWLRTSLCHRTTSKGNTRRLAFVSTRATLLSRNSAQVHSPPESLHHGLEDLSVAPALSDAQRRTIYALSTPPGKGGIAVIRVSGPDAARVYTEIIRTGTTPSPWVAQHRKIVDPESGETLDNGIVLFFKAPKSFTTEDTLELQVHSGRAVLASILAALSKLPFCRPADPGEFTQRAFEGGRMDLTQVESLKDLINAETEVQRRVALRGLGGIQKARFEALRARILDCLMYVEGFIDFGEDTDELGEEKMLENARSHAREIVDSIRAHLTDSRRGEILVSGVKLAIFGPPNAGKSSLFNFLAERDAAITSPIPGTTRDVLTLTLDIGGFPVVLNDTAGIRRTSTDVVEKIGVERAGDVVQTSDMSICVLSLDETLSCASAGPSNFGAVTLTLPDDVLSFVTPDTMFLFNKLDLTQQSSGSSSADHGLLSREKELRNEIKKALRRALPPFPFACEGGQVQRAQGGPHVWTVSLRSGEGTSDFIQGLASALKNRVAYSESQSAEDSPLITQARHRSHLESAVRHLEEFQAFPISQIDIAAESLRYAARAIGAVSGVDVSTDDVLGAIFSSFCVGK